MLDLFGFFPSLMTGGIIFSKEKVNPSFTKFLKWIERLFMGIVKS
jgi:hypothetical protein